MLSFFPEKRLVYKLNLKNKQVFQNFDMFSVDREDFNVEGWYEYMYTVKFKIIFCDQLYNSLHG